MISFMKVSRLAGHISHRDCSLEHNAQIYPLAQSREYSEKMVEGTKKRDECKQTSCSITTWWS